MSRDRELDRLLSDVGELLVQHEGAAADLDRYARYRNDPVGFIEQILGDEPWEAQVEVAEAVRDHPQVTVRSCHAAGKDWLAARLALWWAYARNGLAVLTGPTAAQVEEILMRTEVREAFLSGGLPGDLGVRALRPTGSGRAGILPRTARRVHGMTGLHRAEVLFLMTEAQDPEIDHAWDAAFPATTGAEDRKLMVGNPTEPGTRFHRSHQSGDWHSIKIAEKDIPNVREGRTVVPGLLTREGAHRMAQEYGRESPYCRARLDAEFPDTAEDSLVRQAWLEEAATPGRRSTLRDEEWRYTLGVDVARHGPDATVVCIRKGPHVTGFREWRGADTQETARRVVELLEELHSEESPVLRIVVDVVGIGAGVHDRLAEEIGRFTRLEIGRRRMRRRSTDLVEYNGGSKPQDTERFRNLRAESYWHVRKLLEEGEVALPDDAGLMRELRATRVRFDADGRTAVEAKQAIKGRLGGASPDRADALVMSFAGEVKRAGKKRLRSLSGASGRARRSGRSRPRPARGGRGRKGGALEAVRKATQRQQRRVRDSSR